MDYVELEAKMSKCRNDLMVIIDMWFNKTKSQRNVHIDDVN